MKKIIAVLTAFLVFSNVAWASMFLIKNMEIEDDGEQRPYLTMYTLEGVGQMWEVHDYQIIIVADKIQRGNASFEYKGNPDLIDKSNYFEYSFYEKDQLGEKDTVYVHIVNSNGSVNILGNLENGGSTTGPYSYGELEKDKSTYENTFVEMKWEDNYGDLHSEVIDLHIIREKIIE